MRLSIAAFSAATLAASVAFGAFSYTGGTYSQNFDTLAQPTAPNAVTTGIAWTNNSTLPGWYLTRQPGPGTALTAYGASNGSNNTGNLFSFGTTGNSDRALGGTGSGSSYFGTPIPASNAIAAYWGVQIKNDTGLWLVDLTVTYDLEQWRAGGATTPVAQPLISSWAVNPTDWFDAGFAVGASTNSPTFLNTGSGVGLDGNAAANRVAGITYSLSGFVTNVAPGQTFWVRFRELNDPGNDHSLSIDNFSFRANIVPEPASLGLLGVAGLALARRRR
jgi:hypothetical protein